MSRDVEFDATLRFVDELPALDVPAYVTLDLGLGWRIRRGVDVSLVGQNLFDRTIPSSRRARPRSSPKCNAEFTVDSIGGFECITYGNAQGP